MKLFVKKIDNNAKLPTKATLGSAGYDLFANLKALTIIKAGETVMIGTGIAIELQSSDYVGLIFARSSMGVKFSVIPANAVGVIDSDYRGEIKISLHNYSEVDYVVNPFDRIAQLVIMPVCQPELEERNELSETKRADGGFGSTGK